MPIPEGTPLVAGDLVCRECGWVMRPKVVRVNRGAREVVDHLEYECGKCMYRVKTYGMVQGVIEGMKEGE